MEMIYQAISHCRILSKLGECGVGVVDRAGDIKIKRSVARRF